MKYAGKRRILIRAVSELDLLIKRIRFEKKTDSQISCTNVPFSGRGAFFFPRSCGTFIDADGIFGVAPAGI